MDDWDNDSVDETRRGMIGFGAAAGAGALLLASCVEGDDPPPEDEPLLMGAGNDCLDNIAALKAVLVPPTHGAIFIRGRTSVGDGGEGLFFWDAAETRPDNNLTIVAPNAGSGRWKRQGGGVSGRDSMGVPINRGDTTIINVRWFGAKGDGVTIDTTAIQEALEYVRRLGPGGSQRPGGATLYFPPGRYLIHETLEAGRSIGIRYQGAAVSRIATDFPGDGPNPQGTSVLVWVGDNAALPLFRWCGNYCVFDSLVFQGGFESAPKLLAAGFVLYSDGIVSAGKGWFPNIQFNQCIVGFQCGSDGSPGCDTCSFGRFGADHCGTGFQVANDQGQGYVFQYAKFDDCTTCFDFVRGGALDVQHLHNVRTPTILRIQHGGPSANYYRFGSILIDGETNQPVTWVDQTTDPNFPNQDYANISIESGVCAGSNQGGVNAPAAFQLSGRGVLSVRNVAGGIVDTQFGTAPRKLFELTSVAGASSRTCMAVFENCGLNSLDPENPAHTVGKLNGPGLLRWQLKNCYRGTDNARIADYGNLNGSRGKNDSFTGSSLDIPHRLFGYSGSLNNNVFPRVSVTAQDQTQLWVTNVTATHFRINRPASVGSCPFYWRAEVGP